MLLNPHILQETTVPHPLSPRSGCSGAGSAKAYLHTDSVLRSLPAAVGIRAKTPDGDGVVVSFMPGSVNEEKGEERARDVFLVQLDRAGDGGQVEMALVEADNISCPVAKVCVKWRVRHRSRPKSAAAPQVVPQVCSLAYQCWERTNDGLIVVRGNVHSVCLKREQQSYASAHLIHSLAEHTGLLYTFVRPCGSLAGGPSTCPTAVQGCSMIPCDHTGWSLFLGTFVSFPCCCRGEAVLTHPQSS